MQRYYFEIKIDDALIADDRGRDCLDLAGAHAHAGKIVDDCLRFCPPEPSGSRGRINVIDETGRRLLTVLFPATGRQKRRTNDRTKRRAHRIRGSVGL